MKILIARDAGYCFGVRDAVNMAYDTAKEYGEVYMLGTIVHNERVVENLGKAGAKVVESIDDVPDGETLLFRAHGTAPDLWSKAKNKNISLLAPPGGRTPESRGCRTAPTGSAKPSLRLRQMPECSPLIKIVIMKNHILFKKNLSLRPSPPKN